MHSLIYMFICQQIDVSVLRENMLSEALTSPIAVTDWIACLQQIAIATQSPI
jgi:hypothetical protein